MAVLTRELILAAEDSLTEIVEVPEWGGAVYVKILTGTESDAFSKSLVTFQGQTPSANIADRRAKFAARVMCDEQGKRIFTDADIPALGRKSVLALDRVIEVGERLNKMTVDAVEDELKKSNSSQTTSSGCDSQSTTEPQNENSRKELTTLIS